MMQVDYIKALYDYNYWANERILNAVEGISEAQLNADMHNGMGTMRMTLVHMLSGEWIWRMRWQGDSPTSMLRQEDFPSLAAIQVRWREEEQKMRAFLATLRDDDLSWNIEISF